MSVFSDEMLLKVSTPLTWSLKPYGLAVPSYLIQKSSLVLRHEMSRVGFAELWKTFSRICTLMPSTKWSG